MELTEIYRTDSSVLGNQSLPKISFEIFPPKDRNISSLFEQLRILKRYNPVIVSLTYGASGGLSRFSYEDLKSIRDLELNLMPHFTCVSMLKDEIEKHLISVENLGIENILALRGDIPQYINPDELDFSHANKLVDFIQAKTTLSIGVAGYPEGHIESKNLKDDIKYLKKKVNSGASAIFTQLFFENDKFYKYMDLVQNAGISCPVVAGIMPVRSLKQIEKMTSMAKVTVPEKLRKDLEKYPDKSIEIGTEFAINQCKNLIENEVTSLHFFTLNHSDQVSQILDNIL